MPNRRRASSYQLLKLLETTGHIGVWSLNLRTGEAYGSQGLARITGLSVEYSLHGLLDVLLHPDERVIRGDLFALLYTGRSIECTVRIVRPDRTVRWVAIKSQTVLDGEHNPVRAEGTALDVTGLHEAQLIAERATARYNGLVHAVEAVVWTTSPDGQMRPSSTWQALTGQSALEMQGKGWLSAVHPEDRARTTAAWGEALATATPYRVQHRIICADGSTVWFNIYASPIQYSDGKISEWIGIMLRVAFDISIEPMQNGPEMPDLRGPIVRGARALLNWTVSDLAAAAGVSVSSVRRIEEARDSVQPKIRQALRQALADAGVHFVVDIKGRAGVVSVF